MNNLLKKILFFVFFVNVAYAFPVYVGTIATMNWWQESRNISGWQQNIISSATPAIKQNITTESNDAGLELGVIAAKGGVFSLALNMSAVNQNIVDHIGYKQGSENYNLNEAVGWVFNTSVMPTVQLFAGLRLFATAGLGVVEFNLDSKDSGAGYMGPTINETLWRPGLSAGVGVERYFFKHFLFKLSYLYQDFLPFSITTNDPPPAGIPVGNYKIDSRYRLHASGVAAGLDVVF